MEITVIVPVYNIEDLLPRCVQGLLAQTFEDFELLLVDDGSTDGSAALCRAYVDADSRVRLVGHSENLGLSAARNTGVAAARGRYIAFVDGDDLPAPDYLALLYGLCQREGCPMSVCGYGVISPEDGPPAPGWDGDGTLPALGERVLTAQEQAAALAATVPQTPETGSAPESPALPPHEVLSARAYCRRLFDVDEVTYVTMWGKLFEKSLFQGLTFPQGRIHEDQALIHLLAFAAGRAACTPLRLYGYTKRGGSIMADGFSPRRLDTLTAYSERAAFFDEKGETELAWLTRCTYLVACLQFYGRITPTTPEGAMYKSHLRECFAQMLEQARQSPARRPAYLRRMAFYRLFPGAYRPEKKYPLRRGGIGQGWLQTAAEPQVG